MPRRNTTPRRTETPARKFKRIAGQRGQAINYGWACLAQTGDEELWGCISVNEDEVIEFLRLDANTKLKKGTRYEIRRRVPGNFGRSFGLAWYHSPEMAKANNWTMEALPPDAGYYLVGRFVSEGIR